MVSNSFDWKIAKIRPARIASVRQTGFVVHPIDGMDGQELGTSFSHCWYIQQAEKPHDEIASSIKTKSVGDSESNALLRVIDRVSVCSSQFLDLARL